MSTTTVTAADLPAESGGLLEREHALERLTNALADVRGTVAGRVVLVSGEAGVGKTTLLRTFRERLDPRQRLLWRAATRSSHRARSGRCSRWRRTSAANSQTFSPAG